MRSINFLPLGQTSLKTIICRSIKCDVSKPTSFSSMIRSLASASSSNGSVFSNDGVDIIDPPSNEPPIPVYPSLANEPGSKIESIGEKRARLLYQSRKRGMLENDLLLSTFAAKYLNTLNEFHLQLYDELINGESNDWQIYYWIVGQKETPKIYDNQVMNLLKSHAKNLHREVRIRQPDLHQFHLFFGSFLSLISLFISSQPRCNLLPLV